MRLSPLLLQPTVLAIAVQWDWVTWYCSLLYQLWQCSETESLGTAAYCTSCSSAVRLSPLVLWPVVPASDNRCVLIIGGMVIGRRAISQRRSSSSTIEYTTYPTRTSQWFNTLLRGLQYCLQHSSTAIFAAWQCTGTTSAVGRTWQCTSLGVFLFTISAWQRRPSGLRCAKSLTKPNSCRRQRKREFYFPHVRLSNSVSSIETGDTQKSSRSSLLAHNNALAPILTFLYITLSTVLTYEFLQLQVLSVAGKVVHCFPYACHFRPLTPIAANVSSAFSIIKCVWDEHCLLYSQHDS